MSPAPPDLTSADSGAVGAYVNAFQVGRALGRPSAPAGANAMTGADPAAQALRERIGALNPAQRAFAGHQAEIMTVVGQGLAQLPYAQRRSVLDHMTPALAARGVAPGAIQEFDPTDENLQSALGSAQAIRGLLGEG